MLLLHKLPVGHFRLHPPQFLGSPSVKIQPPLHAEYPLSQTVVGGPPASPASPSASPPPASRVLPSSPDVPPLLVSAPAAPDVPPSVGSLPPSPALPASLAELPPAGHARLASHVWNFDVHPTIGHAIATTTSQWFCFMAPSIRRVAHTFAGCQRLNAIGTDPAPSYSNIYGSACPSLGLRSGVLRAGRVGLEQDGAESRCQASGPASSSSRAQ